MKTFKLNAPSVGVSLMCAFFLGLACFSTRAAEKQTPNVVLISIDDLNNWIGCLEGHPQARTPNMDALAKRGVLFTNAQCQSPVCNPSRASMMTSLYPETTGIYFLSPPVHSVPKAMSNQLLPRRFADAGLQTSFA